jgi:chemotaxis protein MotA
VDKASLGGVVLGVGGIVCGLLLEGGNLSQILQPTAAIIVFGGTLGAVLLQFPLGVVISAFRRLIHVFIEPQQNPRTRRAAKASFHWTPPWKRSKTPS